jgi:hypothetical protein
VETGGWRKKKGGAGRPKATLLKCAKCIFYTWICPITDCILTIVHRSNIFLAL